MPITVSVTRSLNVDYPIDVALNTLWNIQNLEHYEPKVHSAQVQKQTAKTGTYTAWGFFSIVPWQGTFSYTLTDTGFTSELLNSPTTSIKVKGGFLVKANSNHGCQIIHFEKYQLPNWLSCIAPAMRRYVDWSMGRELNNIANLMAKAVLSAEAVTGIEIPGTAQQTPSRVLNNPHPATQQHFTLLDGLRNRATYQPLATTPNEVSEEEADFSLPQAKLS